MKKGVMVAMLVLLAILAKAGMAKQMTWKEVQPLYLKAIETSYREDITVWPEDLFPEAKDFDDKEDMIFMALLGGGNGCYLDRILPLLNLEMKLYDKEITATKDEKAKAKLFRKELRILIAILATLDEQIKVYTDFEAQQTADFTKFLGRVPNPENYSSKGGYKEFLAFYPRYAGKWPGFYDSDLEIQQGNRSWESYHQKEIAELRVVKKYLPDSINDEYYQIIVRGLSGALAFGHGEEK
jgi:hypothetical protein